MPAPQAMFVLTCKADGGTQDVHGFYENNDAGLSQAIRDAWAYLAHHLMSRRAIVRLEFYNPEGDDPRKPTVRDC